MSEEPIVGRLQEFLERRKARDYYIATIALLAVGYVFDFAGVSGFWGQRFGAVVAGFMALAFFFDLRQHGQWWKWLRDSRDRKLYEVNGPHRWAEAESKLLSASGDPSGAKQHVQAAFIETRPEVQKVNDRFWRDDSLHRNALRAQGYCIALGTLFGDLVICL